MAAVPRRLLFALLLGLAAAARPAAQPPTPDTTAPGAFDSPETQRLVERVIEASGTLPPELQDYQATVRTAMYLALASDSTAGGDLTLAVDEFASDVRWHREEKLRQTVRAHRVRLLAPAPYTLGTLLEQPWVVPHLYGSTIRVLSSNIGGVAPAGGRRGEVTAIHPFGVPGPRHYRYRAGDTLRVYTQSGSVTLVPVTVSPRAGTGDRRLRLVVGTFWIDVDRAAVARARFGFAEAGGGVLGETNTFLELENGLWQNRYWLPHLQRRELQVSSSLIGGAAVGRIVNRFDAYELNTGWSTLTPDHALLERELVPDQATLFAGWNEAVGAEAGEYRSTDFADLRLATSGAARADAGGLRLSPYYQRGEHLFRYNRVEGAYLGAGARLLPADPLRRRWDLYATAGWVFAEATPRGELTARWRSDLPGTPRDLARTELNAGAYRRLYDLRSFRPSFEWSWVYAVPALFVGSDQRDYYDATGVELGLTRRRGFWTTRLGTRWERQDTVRRNTTRYLFGTADEFPPLAELEPGTHAAAEGELAYERGSGAYGLGNGLWLSLRGEKGFADFGFTRVVTLASFRRALGPFTLAARLDGGHVTGDAPPQKLFRFGSAEGLGGYAPNEFGGSTAAIARGRFLVPLPPRDPRPRPLAGPFIVPPLRPALVLLGEAGWAEVSQRLRPQLARLGAAPTDGVLGAAGVGVSLFEDALTLEYTGPLRAVDGRRRDGRWYFGLTRWF